MSEHRVHHMKTQKQLPTPANQDIPEKRVLKKYSADEARKIVLERGRVQGDLDADLNRFGRDIFPPLFQGGEEEQEKAHEEYLSLLLPVMYGLEVETHAALMGSLQQDYRGMAKELSTQIIKEYSCVTHAEKMLVEVIVNSFTRTLCASKELTEGSVAPGASITENRTKYLAVLSKEHDRANRQFLSSLMMLKQIKAPTIEMNIKANTAFVAQNQQINATDHEINEPK
jgi:hypothetical protein